MITWLVKYDRDSKIWKDSSIEQICANGLAVGALLNKYHTEKYISLKSNNINLFRKKWRMFEEKILFDN